MTYTQIQEANSRMEYLRNQIRISEERLAVLGTNIPNNPSWEGEYDLALNHAVACKIELDDLQGIMEAEFLDDEFGPDAS